MLSPKTFFLIAQLAFIALSFLTSIFIDRLLAVTLLTLFLAWKMYTELFLPTLLVRKLGDSRLNRRGLRTSLKNSELGVNPQKTQLLKLAPPWPTALLIPCKKPTLLMNPDLDLKLDDTDKKIFFRWASLAFENHLPLYGLRFYSATFPFLKGARWLDTLLKNQNHSQFHIESSLFRVFRWVFTPIIRQQLEVRQALWEEFSQDDVERFAGKMEGLAQSHDDQAPLSLNLLMLDARMGAQKNKPLVIAQNVAEKGIPYGSPTTTGS